MLQTHVTFSPVAYASTTTEASSETVFFFFGFGLFFFFTSRFNWCLFCTKKKRVVSKHVKTHDGGECETEAGQLRKQWRYSRIFAFAKIWTSYISILKGKYISDSILGLHFLEKKEILGGNRTLELRQRAKVSSRRTFSFLAIEQLG